MPYPHAATTDRHSRTGDYVFSTNSAIWQTNSQWTGMVFGPAAAILQIAHPRIAHGVARHSDFRNDTLGRLRRTLRDVNNIAFGTHAEAEAVRAHLHTVHSAVRGTADNGVAYNAFDQDLMVWVLATLVMASVQGHELVFGAMPGESKQQLLTDMARFGSYFGVRPDSRTDRWQDFDDYYQSMLHGDVLGSDPISGTLARCLVKPEGRICERTLGLCLDFLPVETLPPHLLNPLTLRSTSWSRLKMRTFRRVFPVAFRRLPERRKYYRRSAIRRFENR